MKFSCDRCGKKYATAETPTPGRVYKLKCKACGHVIVVRTPAAPAATSSSADEAARAASPDVEAGVEQAAQPTTPSVPYQIPAGTPVPRIGEPTMEISMAQVDQFPPASATTPPPAEPAKPQEGGYVDIFADSAQPSAPPPVSDDPFLKAARESLPEGFGGGASLPDPFADMRDELEKPSSPPAATPEPPRPPVTPAVFQPPAPPKAEKKKSGLPVALIGVGVAAVLGIVVVVALTSGKKPEPPPAPPPAPVAAPAPAPVPPPPAPAPAPEPKKAEPAKAEPKKGKDDQKNEQARLDAERKRAEAQAEADRKRAEAKGEADRKRAEAKAEADRKRAEAQAEADRKRAEAKAEADRKREQARLDAERKREEDRRREEEKRLAKAEASKPVQLPDAASALSPEAVQKVVNASRKAFENCISEASRKGSDIKFDGRKVALRLNVNPNGFVTYPTLDDVTLNRTDLGECLKSAARLMVFPKFQGDVFHVEVPLTLRGG